MSEIPWPAADVSKLTPTLGVVRGSAGAALKGTIERNGTLVLSKATDADGFGMGTKKNQFYGKHRSVKLGFSRGI